MLVGGHQQARILVFFSFRCMVLLLGRLHRLCCSHCIIAPLHLFHGLSSLSYHSVVVNHTLFSLMYMSIILLPACELDV
jgi:hypothetical protein